MHKIIFRNRESMYPMDIFYRISQASDTIGGDPERDPDYWDTSGPRTNYEDSKAYPKKIKLDELFKINPTFKFNLNGETSSNVTVFTSNERTVVLGDSSFNNHNILPRDTDNKLTIGDYFIGFYNDRDYSTDQKKIVLNIYNNEGVFVERKTIIWTPKREVEKSSYEWKN